VRDVEESLAAYQHDIAAPVVDPHAHHAVGVELDLAAIAQRDLLAPADGGDVGLPTVPKGERPGTENRKSGDRGRGQPTAARQVHARSPAAAARRRGGFARRPLRPRSLRHLRGLDQLDPGQQLGIDGPIGRPQ